MLVLNVYYQLKPGVREKYIEEVVAAGILEKSNQEAGCRKYEFYRPLNDPDRLLLVEQYVDDDAFAVHKSGAHFAKLQEIKSEYVISTTLNILRS